ncbi:31822_t:CDS:1, partial [Gigaspora margarita]
PLSKITSQLADMNQEQLATLFEFLNYGPVTSEELTDQKLSLSNNMTKELMDQE